jgi:hypothetical protein
MALPVAKVAMMPIDLAPIKYICTRYEHYDSLAAGTIMNQTKKHLRLWLKERLWFTTRESSVKVINLKELMDFGIYGTAWHWLQKLRRCATRKGQLEYRLKLK